MWKYSLTGALAALIVSAVMAIPVQPDVLSVGGGPMFHCQIGERLGTEPDSLRLFAAVSIPNDHLTFVRDDEMGFVATFELSVSIFRDGEGLFDERIRTIEVPTPIYKDTNSRTKHAVHSEEFLVAPGKYSVRVSVTDRESRRKSNWKGELELQPKDTLLEVSDLYWVSEDARLATAGVPRLVESFPSAEQEADARIEIFSAGQDSVQATWAVVDKSSDTIQFQLTKIAPTRKIQIHEFTVRLDSLNVGEYELSFEAVGNGRREYRTREFSVHISGVPSSVTDLELAIRELKYIASGEENRRLRSATPEERERLFREFWKRRDPTPDTEENELLDEYFLRVEYANEQFSTHRNGWETDRGRIYILYGEPTQIERHPFDAAARPYEIWYYHNLNKRFVFVDYSGFGEYTLAGPTWGY